MQLVNVSKSYNGNRVLNNINLTFDRNGLVFILGPSGSGKSTLLNIAGMLDPDFVGGLFIGGHRVTDKRNEYNEYRSKLIAFIFQEFNLIKSLSVKENILASLKLSNTDFNPDKYKEIMSELGILQYEDRMIDTLSGGEKQRVAIARAILRGSKIILADEPTGNLDEGNAEVIIKALREISKQCIVIIASHNLMLAQKYADRIITIRHNHIVEDIDKGYSSNEKNNLSSQTSKVRLGLKWYLRLSIKNFRLRRRKLIPIIITMSIALLCIGIVLGFYNGINHVIDGVNKTILDSDLISVYNFNEEGHFYCTIDDAYYNNVIESVDYRKVLPYYEPTEVSVDYNSGIEDAKVSVIDDTDFMRGRFDDLDGRYIEKSNEILVNTILAEKLTGDRDCIGTKVIISTETGFQAECVISGVTKHFDNNYDDRIYMSKDLNEQMSLVNIREETLLGYLEDNFNSYVYCDIAIKGSEHKIIAGEDLGKIDKGILVNASGLNSIISVLLPEYSPLSLDDINQGNIPEEILDSVLGSEIRLTALDLILFDKLTISGICTEQEASNTLKLYTDSKTIDRLSQPRVNKINIYLADYSTEAKDSIIKTFDDRNIYYTVPADQTGFMIMNRMSIITKVMAIIAVIFILLTIQMINLYVKIAALDRIYEVGVLKSMGANDRNVFIMFTLDNAILGLVLSAFACIILGLFNIINVTKFLSLSSIGSVGLYKPSILHLLPITIIGCIMTGLAGLKETVSIARMPVTDAIRTKGI